MNVKRHSDEVVYALDPVVAVDRGFVDGLVQAADKAPRKRTRLCAHKGAEDRLHEMIIVLKRGTYLRPHRHRDKVESFHIITGRADVFTFDETGKTKSVVGLGDWASGRAFFYRNEASDYHTVHVRSEVVIFHETTNGPFDRAQTTFAPWAPEEGDAPGVERFMKRLEGEASGS